MSKKGLKAILLSAEWCSGCNAMKPYFAEECKRLGVRFEILDVEENDGLNLSIKHTVRNVPTILFFENNKLVGKEVGNTSWENIKNYVND